MRSCLPRLFLLCLAAGIGLPAASQPAAAFHPSNWTTEQHMQCGASQVSIATRCSEQIEDLPYCATQTLTVSTGREVHQTRFTLPFEDGNQPMIVGATCYRKGQEGFIMLSRTNFGNCMACEWSDAFSSNGTYLGSEEGMQGGERLSERGNDLPHRPVPPDVAAQLKAMHPMDRYQSAAIPLISRARPRH